MAVHAGSGLLIAIVPTQHDFLSVSPQCPVVSSHPPPHTSSSLSLLTFSQVSGSVVLFSWHRESELKEERVDLFDLE